MTQTQVQTVLEVKNLKTQFDTQDGMVHAVNNPHTAEKYPNSVAGLNARAEALTAGRIERALLDELRHLIRIISE